jgi:hypothetical protein
MAKAAISRFGRDEKRTFNVQLIESVCAQAAA